MATKQNFLCVDLKFEGNTSVIKEGESRKGVLTYENEDKFHFVFTENEGKPHVAHPELHWRLLARTMLKWSSTSITPIMPTVATWLICWHAKSKRWVRT